MRKSLLANWQTAARERDGERERESGKEDKYLNKEIHLERLKAKRLEMSVCVCECWHMQIASAAQPSCIVCLFICLIVFVFASQYGKWKWKWAWKWLWKWKCEWRMRVANGIVATVHVRPVGF